MLSTFYVFDPASEFKEGYYNNFFDSLDDDGVILRLISYIWPLIYRFKFSSSYSTIVNFLSIWNFFKEGDACYYEGNWSKSISDDKVGILLIVYRLSDCIF